MKVSYWLMIILLFSLKNVYAVWSHPLGTVIGTPNWSYDLQTIYDGNPDTWTQLEESSGLYSAPQLSEKIPHQPPL